jgi:hypothetical protein
MACYEADIKTFLKQQLTLSTFMPGFGLMAYGLRAGIFNALGADRGIADQWADFSLSGYFVPGVQ